MLSKTVLILLTKSGCRKSRLPRCVTWWGNPGATTRAIPAISWSYYTTSIVLKD